MLERIMRPLAALLLFTLSGAVAAANDDIPLNELAFLDKIQTISKATILEQLGDPSNIINIRNRQTNELTGAIWRYRYLNTSEDGDYYKATELDFIGDRVVTVVFINTDFEDADTAALPADAECPASC